MKLYTVITINRRTGEAVLALAAAVGHPEAKLHAAHA